MKNSLTASIIEKIKLFDIPQGANDDLLNARLKDDLLFDSLDAVELLIMLEKEFCVNIDESILDHVSTVGHLISAVENEIRKIEESSHQIP